MVKMFFILFGVLAFCQAVCGQSVSKVWVADRKDGTYMNPVLHADYSDPDVCAVGDDFYMTASSFNCTPRVGTPIRRELFTGIPIGFTRLRVIYMRSKPSSIASLPRIW